MICPWIVLALAMPIFAGLLWSFRRLAPTRPRGGGGGGGAVGGAFAATIYCVHCAEVSAIFVPTWYSFPSCRPPGWARSLGPRVLRW